MKRRLLISLFVVFSMFSCGVARAQYVEPHFGIYLTSPIGVLSKFGAGFEYRLSLQHALLLNYTQYYGFFPGFQGSLQYRIYFTDRRKSSNSENFIYGKAGLGYANYTANNGYNQVSILGDGRNDYAAPGSYLLAGAGVGRHFNFDWFFMEINAGFKFAQVTNAPTVYNEHLFYLTGPGSFFDFNFHFGVQF